MILIALLAAFAAPSGPGSLPDPLGPAATGQLQCHSPDPVGKTCQSLAGYARAPSGEIINTALILLSSKPVVVMEVVAPVVVKDGAVCATLRQADTDTANFTVDGQPVGPDRLGAARAGVSAMMKMLLGHEACSTYEPAGDMLLAKAALDGVAIPAANE